MDWSSLAEGAKALFESAGAGLSAADNAIKSIKGIRDLFKADDKSPAAREAREKLIDLQDQLLAMREQASTLKASLADLKEQLAEREDFLAQAQNYVLTETAPNSVAYQFKAPATQAEKAVYLCAPCFEKKKRSLLQFEEQDWHYNTLRCLTCHGSIRVPNGIKMEVLTGPVRRRELW